MAQLPASGISQGADIGDQTGGTFMTVRIKGRHLQITPAISEYIDSKLPRIEKYTDRMHDLEIVLEKDAYEHKADLSLKDGPIAVRASTKDPNLVRAIDALIDKVEVQLKKKWAKKRGMTKRKRDEPAKRLGTVVSSREAPLPLPTDKPGRTVPKGRPVTVGKIGIKVFPVVSETTPVLTVEAAAEALFYRDENFLYFREKKSGSPRIMYRRKDGQFGLFEPDTKD